MKYSIKKVKGKIKKIADTMFSSNYKLNHQDRGLINFIDVGSVGGLPDPWRANANQIKFLLNFEPNESPRRGTNVLTYNSALWEQEATLPFYIYQGGNGSGSSLFEQNFDYVRSNYETLRQSGRRDLAETWFERSGLVRQTEIKCRTLDNVLDEEFPSTPFHFLKIDAQGAEYNILKGASKLLLESCVGLHLELFTLPLYKGSVLLEDVSSYLSDFGFRLAKKFPAHGTFDSQHDCLFVKSQKKSEVLSLIHKLYGITE